MGAEQSYNALKLGMHIFFAIRLDNPVSFDRVSSTSAQSERHSRLATSSILGASFEAFSVESHFEKAHRNRNFVLPERQL